VADNFQYYRTTVFVIGDGSIDWAKDFAIVTAHNPDGKPPVVEQEGASGKPDDWLTQEQQRLNQTAHLRLRSDLLQLTKPRWLPSFLFRLYLKLCSAVQLVSRSASTRTCAITGYSPDFIHHETGWAANITLNQALHLGRIYRQEAIFWISAGQLYLVSCTIGAIPEPLGPWSSRLRTFPQNK
jgi:hypothetical protein